MKPPSLRTTDGKTSCASCRSFNGVDRCERFDAPVRPFNLCDAYDRQEKTPSLRDGTGTVQINVTAGASDAHHTAGA